MKKADLDALEALEKAATPGPWENRVAGIEGDNYIAGTGPWYRVLNDPDQAVSDARLIAALRNAAPALIAELRALRELRERTRGYVSYAEPLLASANDLADAIGRKWGVEI